MTRFQATAPDGSVLRFASATRSYSHAVLSRPTEAHAGDSGKRRGWKLYARVGRPDLVAGALGEASRVLNSLGTFDRVRRRWTYEPLAEPRFELLVVEVTATEARPRAKGCRGTGAKPAPDHRGDLAVCPSCETFQQLGSESGRFVPHVPRERDELAYDV